jgi:hypothetical protein
MPILAAFVSIGPVAQHRGEPRYGQRVFDPFGFPGGRASTARPGHRPCGSRHGRQRSAIRSPAHHRGPVAWGVTPLRNTRRATLLSVVSKPGNPVTARDRPRWTSTRRMWPLRVQTRARGPCADDGHTPATFGNGPRGGPAAGTRHRPFACGESRVMTSGADLVNPRASERACLCTSATRGFPMPEPARSS